MEVPKPKADSGFLIVVRWHTTHLVLLINMYILPTDFAIVRSVHIYCTNLAKILLFFSTFSQLFKKRCTTRINDDRL